MGNCGSRHYNLPAVTPRTTEEWARIGLRETLKVHKWLTQQLVKQEAKQKRSSVKSNTGGTNDNTVSSSLPSSPGTDTTSSSTPPTVFDSSLVIRVRYTISSHSGVGDLEIYETPATLAAVREDIRNLARDIGGAHRLGEGNVLHEDRFLRIAGWLVMNRAIVTTCPIPLTMRLLPTQCHTLLPELTTHKIKQLLQRSRILMNKSDIHNSYVISEFAVDRWLSKEKASIGDSVFFPFFWRVVDTSLVLPSDHSANAHLRYTPAEFVQAVDRFCTFTEEELLRFVFFCLARIGTAPGETPFISLSSLTKEFSELQEAWLDRTHPSRSFLDEIKKRMSILNKNMDERVRIMKTAACVTYSEKYDRSNIDTESTSSSSHPNYHYTQSRRSSFNSLVKGPEDLMTVGEFLDMAKRSPISVFDAIYLQLHMRRKTFGEDFWVARQKDILNLRARSRASIVFPSNKEGGENASSSSASSNSDSFGNLYYYGYDAQRMDPLPDPYSLSTLPTLAKIEPLQVSLAVRFALASGTYKTPSPKDEPYITPATSHHHLVPLDRKHSSANANTIDSSVNGGYSSPLPSAPTLTAEEIDSLNEKGKNKSKKSITSETKRKLSNLSSTKRTVEKENDVSISNDNNNQNRRLSFNRSKSMTNTPSGTSPIGNIFPSLHNIEGIVSVNDDEENIATVITYGTEKKSNDGNIESVVPSAPSLGASKRSNEGLIDSMIHPVDRSLNISVEPSHSRRSSIASDNNESNLYPSRKLSSRPASATNNSTSNSVTTVGNTNISSSCGTTNSNGNERRLYQGRKKKHNKSKGKIEIEDSDPFDVDDEAAAAHWKASHN